MSLRYISNQQRWLGEAINGVKHPLNIDALWSAPQLAGIGLEVIPPVPAPTQAEIEASNVVRRDANAGLMEVADSYLGAFALVCLDEFNRLHKINRDLFAAIQAATSLADLKTRAAAISPQPANDRTLTQLKTALRSKMG